jgi:hypothetical protein
MTTNVGTTLSIATGKPTAEDASSYGALSFVVIEGVLTIPPIGDTAEPNKSSLLKTGRTLNDMGARTLGDLSITFEEVSPDAGMDDVRACVNDTDYSFKVAYPDGKTKYFYGKVDNIQENEASTSTKRGGSFMIFPNSGEVIVDA